MAQLTLEVNGKPYTIGCEDGQEAHVRSLAVIIDARVREIAPDAGAMGETRLILLSALMLPLSFAFFDWEHADGQPAADPLALLEALRRYGDRFTIFCQAGCPIIIGSSTHGPVFYNILRVDNFSGVGNPLIAIHHL